MKYLPARKVAISLTGFIHLVLPKERVKSLANRLALLKPDDPEIKKYNFDVDSALIAISHAETEDKIKAILQDLPDEVFLALLLRWHDRVKKLVMEVDPPVVFIPDHVTKNIVGIIIRIVLVEDQTRVADKNNPS